MPKARNSNDIVGRAVISRDETRGGEGVHREGSMLVPSKIKTAESEPRGIIKRDSSRVKGVAHECMEKVNVFLRLLSGAPWSDHPLSEVIFLVSWKKRN